MLLPLLFPVVINIVNAQFGELAGLATSLLSGATGGGAGLGELGSLAASGGGGGLAQLLTSGAIDAAPRGVGLLQTLNLLAQNALSLTGQGVGILNSASESKWFPAAVGYAVANNEKLHDRLSLASAAASDNDGRQEQPIVRIDQLPDFGLLPLKRYGTTGEKKSSSQVDDDSEESTDPQSSVVSEPIDKDEKKIPSTSIDFSSDPSIAPPADYNRSKVFEIDRSIETDYEQELAKEDAQLDEQELSEEDAQLDEQLAEEDAQLDELAEEIAQSDEQKLAEEVAQLDEQELTENKQSELTENNQNNLWAGKKRIINIRPISATTTTTTTTIIPTDADPLIELFSSIDEIPQLSSVTDSVSIIHLPTTTTSPTTTATTTIRLSSDVPNLDELLALLRNSSDRSQISDIIEQIIPTNRPKSDNFLMSIADFTRASVTNGITASAAPKKPNRRPIVLHKIGPKSRYRPTSTRIPKYRSNGRIMAAKVVDNRYRIQGDNSNSSSSDNDNQSRHAPQQLLETTTITTAQTNDYQPSDQHNYNEHQYHYQLPQHHYHHHIHPVFLPPHPFTVASSKLFSGGASSAPTGLPTLFDAILSSHRQHPLVLPTTFTNYITPPVHPLIFG